MATEILCPRAGRGSEKAPEAAAFSGTDPVQDAMGASTFSFASLLYSQFGSIGNSALFNTLAGG
jgi:hypothetical protein